jgi:hypothetical protein
MVEILLGLQAKLLRVLQEREFIPLSKTKPQAFDVKIISVASTGLEKAVELGVFQEDLRYRLEVIPVSLPPLLARRVDARELFDYFLCQQFARHDLEFIKVDPGVYQNVSNYDWPENVHEMVNVCTCVAAIVALMLPIFLFSCAAGVDSERFFSAQDQKLGQLQEMPEPFTRRYPTLDQRQLSRGSSAPDIIKKETSAHHNCTVEEETIFVNDLPLLDVLFIDADILDALLELSLLAGISIISDDSIEGTVSINFLDNA